MQFDYNMLQSLLALSDDQLWQAICSIARQSGVVLPQSAPPSAELKRLRNALNNTQNPNINEALQIVNKYKKQKGV